MKQISTNVVLTNKFAGYNDIFQVVKIRIADQNKANKGHHKNPYNSGMSTYLLDVERRIITGTLNKFNQIDISISSVFHDELLVDVNDNAKYYIVEHKYNILRKLEGPVHDELGFNVKLEAKLLQPTNDDLGKFEHYIPFVNERFKSNECAEYVARQKSICKINEMLRSSEYLETDVTIADVVYEMFKDHFVTSTFGGKASNKALTWFQSKKRNMCVRWDT